MKTYLIRSVKYLIALCVLCVAIIALNLATGMSVLSFDETLFVLLQTPRGWLMIGVIIVLAALYPRFGFVRYTVEGDVEKDRTQLDHAFEAAGFALHRTEGRVLRFRATSLLRRAMMLFEDEVLVEQQGVGIELRGNRRAVARVRYVLEGYLRNKYRYADENE